MHHFFVSPEQIDDKYVTITGGDVNHIKNVLRMKIDEELLISNGQDKDYYCKIESISDEEIKAIIFIKQLIMTKILTYRREICK